MRIKNLFFPLALLVLFACSKSEITVPPGNDDANLANTTPLSNTTMKKMEGIYKLSAGNENLGTEFVCKTSKYRVSFFSNTGGIFIILKYGYQPLDGSIQFSGFWRYSETASQGNIQFSVSTADGSTDLIAGIVTNLKLQGVFASNNMTLKYDRDFSTFTKNNELMIFGHHGIQTTANPPYTENSIDGVKFDEGYGVNGLEYDVRLSKDNVPLHAHDPSINVRVTQKGPISGAWDQYGYKFLYEYVRLIDGQRIASVEHALKVFVDSTTMKYFWMDIKGNPDVFKYLEPIVRDAYANANAKGRDVVIFAGMPSASVIDEFKKQPSYATLPTLCEQSLDLALQNGSKYFGPRYSEGLLLDDVARAHANGIKVISWTLNDKNLIRNYLVNGKFDGFITDYPAYVIYDYYTLF